MTDRDLKPENMPDPEIAVRCPTCASKPGERCASLINGRYYPDTVHAARRKTAQESR